MAESTALPLVEPNRGWKKLILALFAFFVVPAILQAFVPVDETMMLFVPAMAACALVGWWAGGRAYSALLWVALAVFLARQDVATTGSVFGIMVRGWSLLLAGGFGVACIVGVNRPLFTKALGTVVIALGIGVMMSMFGPMRLSGSANALAVDFSRRNGEAMQAINKTIELYPTQWQELSANNPSLA